MKRPAAVFTIALALGAMILVPWAAARADTREEGPIEIEKCRTISEAGSYKLVNNLTATGNCLVITAPFVTIDLAGFSIIGGPNAGFGVLAAPSSGQLEGIAVRNGSIVGFVGGPPFGGIRGGGVDLSSAIGSIVEGLRVAGAIGSTDGIIASGIVRGNTVIFILGFPGGTATGMTATGTVTGNRVINSRFTQISVGQGSTVIGNTAGGGTFGGGIGLSVDCPSNVTNNTAIGNGLNLDLIGDGCNNTNNVAP